MEEAVQDGVGLLPREAGGQLLLQGGVAEDPGQRVQEGRQRHQRQDHRAYVAVLGEVQLQREGQEVREHVRHPRAREDYDVQYVAVVQLFLKHVSSMYVCSLPDPGGPAGCV